MLNLKFISSEEFLGQDSEIQREFLRLCNYTQMIYADNGTIKFGEFLANSGHIPLLTEGQLKDFIESKFGCMDITVIDIEDGNGIIKYEIDCCTYVEDEGFGENTLFKVYANDTLNAYWQVACSVIVK